MIDLQKSIFAKIFGSALCVFLTQQASADILTCSPPEMHYPFPKTPTANQWVRMAGGPSHEICVEIPSKKSVSEAHCLTDVIIVVPGETRPDYYHCLSNKSCAGKGTFASMQRRPSPKPGTDLFCTTYLNQGGHG
jgi:hypothetical protein